MGGIFRKRLFVGIGGTVINSKTTEGFITNSLSVKVQPDRPALFGNDMLRMVIEYNGQGNATQEFSFLQFPFTSAGRELITLIGKHGSEKDFLYFVKLLIKKNPIGASFVITPKRVVVKDNSIWLEKIDLESDVST